MKNEIASYLEENIKRFKNAEYKIVDNKIQSYTGNTNSFK